MTLERIRKIQEAVAVLNSISQEEWESLKKKGVVSDIPNQSDENSKLTMLNKVNRLLRELGVSANKRGYNYFREAILMMIDNPQYTTVLYSAIAQKYNTTPSKVERDIRYAIETAWDKGNPDVQMEIFGYTISSERGKPTNSEAIAGIAEYLKYPQ